SRTLFATYQVQLLEFSDSSVGEAPSFRRALADSVANAFRRDQRSREPLPESACSTPDMCRPRRLFQAVLVKIGKRLVDVAEVLEVVQRNYADIPWQVSTQGFADHLKLHRLD